MEQDENLDGDSVNKVGFPEKSYLCVTPCQENVFNSRYEENINNEKSQDALYQRFLTRKRCSSEFYSTQSEKQPRFEKCNKKVTNIPSSYIEPEEKNWDDEDSSIQTMSMSSEQNDNWNKENIQSHHNVDHITVEDLNKAFLSRDTLERIVHMPLFEKTVLNCFVGINVGSGRIDSPYKPAQVIGVSRSKHIYPLGSTKSDRKLRVQLENTIGRYGLNVVSNCKFTQEEFAYWQNNWKSHNNDMPTLKLLNEKCVHIEKAINHVYSDKDIDKILSEKKRLGIAPVNIMKKKVLLMCDRHVAIHENNQIKLEKLNKELAQLEETTNNFSSKSSPFPRSRDPVPVDVPLQRKSDTMINNIGHIHTCPYELNNFDLDIDIQLFSEQR